MANALAWLLGRPDQTGQPSPIAYDDGQPSLRAYHPSPSEQFGNWISDLLGAGPGASLPHQIFAKGVPSVLSLFPPIGVGLSAADFAHARAADDPMGAAAAAIGMVPGAGKLGKLSAADVIKAKAQSINAVEQVFKGASVSSANPVDLWHPTTDVKKLAPGQKVTAGPGGPVGTFKGVTQGGTTIVDWKNAQSKAAGLPDLPFSPSSQDIAKSIATPKPGSTEDILAQISAVLEGKPNSVTSNTNPVTKIAASTSAGNPLPPIASGNPLKVMNETSHEILLHPNEPLSGGNPIWVDKNNVVKKDNQWFMKEGASPKSAMEADYLKPISPVATPAASKPVLDYEKDDTGLYHIFDATSGKTLTVVDKESQAKAWINQKKAEGMELTPSKITSPPSAPLKSIENSSGYPSLPTHWEPNPTFDNQVTDLIAKDFSPVDWKTYTPKKYSPMQESSVPKLTQVAPEHVQGLGGNTNLSLWKGGNVPGYPEELPDVTGKVAPNIGGAPKNKFEKAFFLADNPHVAGSYTKGHGAGPSPYVALPQKVAEVDWTDLAKKFGVSKQYTTTAGYTPMLMKYIIDSARKKNLDMVIAHNISDLGGNQSQYIVLNTNVLRAPSAKFDPSKLHLRYPLAGLAGAGVYTYGASQDPAAAAEKPHINDVLPSIEAAFSSPGVKLPLRSQ